MIVVLASISVAPEKLSDFLEIFNANIPSVRQENGCIEYFPAIDQDVNLPPQHLDENVVTIIEKWESLAALREHLASPHMLAYREKTKELVTDVSIKVLKEV